MINAETRLIGWLRQHKYRKLLHRHDGSFVAVDEADKLYTEASNIGELALLVEGYPVCFKKMEPSRYA